MTTTTDLGFDLPPTDGAPKGQQDGSIRIELRGVPIDLCPAGVAWLPATRTLLVADLHLEKASAFAARGQFLPPYDTAETLTRLEAAVAARAPARVVCLGDSVHDQGFAARLAPADRARLAALVARADDWVWIVGNHDPVPPVSIGGRVADVLRLDGLVLRHAPEGELGEVVGHLHPAARILRRGRSVRRRCFVSDGARLLLPAFGAFTGGLSATDPAIARWFDGACARAHLLGRDRVWTVALNACSGP